MEAQDDTTTRSDISLEKEPDSSEQVVEPTEKEKITKGINMVGDYLHIPLLKILNGTSFFIVIYITAWTLNSLYPTLVHFDLPELRAFYIMLIGKQTAEHTVNSIFNSAKDKYPTNTK